MNGTFDRAVSQPEGHLAFGGNGLAMCIGNDDRRTVERLVIIRSIIAERTCHGEIIARYVTLSDDRRCVVSGIGIVRARDEARDAHAADELQDDEPYHETAE